MSKVDEDKHDEVKDEIGQYIIDEILISLSKGDSPVEGETFDLLDGKYAKKNKGGNRTPNLRLDGDMLKSLDYEITPDGIEVGIFDESQQGKADGHNKLSGIKGNIPRRRFIPGRSGKLSRFNDSIMNGIDEIISEYESDEEVGQLDSLENILSLDGGNTGNVNLDLDSLLGDDFLDQLMGL